MLVFAVLTPIVVAIYSTNDFERHQVKIRILVIRVRRKERGVCIGLRAVGSLGKICPSAAAREAFVTEFQVPLEA